MSDLIAVPLSAWTTEVIGGNMRRLRASSLALNTGWMMLGNGVRLIIQAAYFVVIARVLGVSGYGAFVGASALVAFFAPFAGLGFGNLLVRNASRSREALAESWGNALLVNAIAGPVLLCAVGFGGYVMFRHVIALPIILAVGSSDLLLIAPLNLATSVFQVENRLRPMAQLQATSNATRLAGACMLPFLFRHPTAQSWSYVYAAATAVTSVIAVWMVWPLTGAPHARWRTIRREARQGLSFSVSLSALNTNNDMDKTMLARMASLDVVGIYAAAYRVVDVAFVPVRSLVAAAYADYFRAGERGLASSCAYAKRLLRMGATYAALAGICLLLFAPLVPRLLGHEYVRTVEALRWLAFLPLMKTFQYFLGDALTGAGYQQSRMTLQIIAATLNVAANLWFIAKWSWRGAAWTSLMADGFLAVALLALIVLLLPDRSARTSAAPLSVCDIA